VLDVEGAFVQDQIRDGDFLGTMDTPSGETTAMRTPLLIDGVRPEIRSGPRKLGEDTREIFDIPPTD
jgi:crotonobetainyl-CoA:carnitine CoA-transferase CaiB-like acyl-CoA transferase